ncbi:hypothetical protein, partial [Streptomyces griseus]|uniref:hypothetical protein n=1 Tax=Streptomyces griseus TaxID=1911 RepID=UPI001C564E3E
EHIVLYSYGRPPGAADRVGGTESIGGASLAVGPGARAIPAASAPRTTAATAKLHGVTLTASAPVAPA